MATTDVEKNVDEISRIFRKPISDIYSALFVVVVAIVDLFQNHVLLNRVWKIALIRNTLRLTFAIKQTTKYLIV